MNALPEPESVKRAHRRQRAAMLAVLPVDRPDLREALESIIEEDGMTWEAIGSEVAGLLSALKLIVKEGDLWVCRWDAFIAERRRVAAMVRSAELLPGLVPGEAAGDPSEPLVWRALRAISGSSVGLTRKELEMVLNAGGVSSDNALSTLVRRGFVDSRGRSYRPGRLFVWSATKAGRDALQALDQRRGKA